jgi:hypothetical protein
LSLENPNVNVYRVTLADSLKATLTVMRELERVALAEPLFVKWIKQNFSGDCTPCHLVKIWLYCRNNFIYVPDDTDEVVISPAIMLKERRGDCDDFALFIHTVLNALGIPCKYILLGRDRDRPTHIAVYSMNKVIDGTNDRFNFIPSKYQFYSLV